MKLLGKRNGSCFNNKELPLHAGAASGVAPSSEDLTMHQGWTLRRARVTGSSGFVI